MYNCIVLILFVTFVDLSCDKSILTNHL